MNGKPWRVTFLSLFVALVVVAISLAVFFTWSSRAREQARRNQCSDHLRNLVTAVHRYENVHDEFPPLATDDPGWSWAMLLTPYLERVAAPEFPLTEVPASDAASGYVLQFHQADLTCPARRTDVKQRLEGPFKGGRPTDYAAVSTADWDLRWTSDSNGVLVYRLSPPTANQPARSGVGINDIIDGLSMTAIFGEKHMRPEWLGGPLDDPAVIARQGPLLERLAGARAGKRGLAHDVNDEDEWKFGSWHNGITNFAMCDGSQRPVSINVDLKILSQMTCRNDTLVRQPDEVAPTGDPLEL